MYLRVTRGRIDPARIDELARGVAPDLTAAIKWLPGNQSYVTGVDRTSGRLVAVSTWDTEGHARWPRQALGDFVPRLQALGVQLDPPEFFEVTTT
jgi:hypothetical protein